MATVKEARVGTVTRWTTFGDDGKRITTYKSEGEALISIGLCPELTSLGRHSIRSYRCRQPIKTGGARMCNKHLGIAKRRAAKEAEQRAEWDRKKTVEQTVYARAKEMLEEIRKVVPDTTDWSVQANVHFTGRGGPEYRSGLVVDEKVLKSLVALAKKGKKAK